MNVTVFAGVFDPTTEKWLAYPSGPTRLATGAKPPPLVERYGGHIEVNAKLGQLVGIDTTKTVGFLLFYDSPTDLSVDWNAASINLLNHQNRAVPEQFRQAILDVIHESTGLNVKSR